MKLLPADFQLDKYGLHARLVNEDDAAFICKIRSNPRIDLYMHGTVATVEEQKAWIRSYKERERKGEDFYFIFSTPEGKPCGVCRLYNIQPGEFTLGSWVFDLEAPKNSSILAEIMTREIGFGLYPDSRMCFDTNVNNTTVMRYGLSYKSQLIKQIGDQQFFFCLREDCEPKMKQYVRMLYKDE